MKNINFLTFRSKNRLFRITVLVIFYAFVTTSVAQPVFAQNHLSPKTVLVNSREGLLARLETLVRYAKNHPDSADATRVAADGLIIKLGFEHEQGDGVREEDLRYARGVHALLYNSVREQVSPGDGINANQKPVSARQLTVGRSNRALRHIDLQRTSVLDALLEQLDERIETAVSVPQDRDDPRDELRRHLKKFVPDAAKGLEAGVFSAFPHRFRSGDEHVLGFGQEGRLALAQEFFDEKTDLYAHRLQAAFIALYQSAFPGSAVTHPEFDPAAYENLLRLRALWFWRMPQRYSYGMHVQKLESLENNLLGVTIERLSQQRQSGSTGSAFQQIRQRQPSAVLGAGRFGNSLKDFREEMFPFARLIERQVLSSMRSQPNRSRAMEDIARGIRDWIERGGRERIESIRSRTRLSFEGRVPLYSSGPAWNDSSIRIYYNPVGAQGAAWHSYINPVITINTGDTQEQHLSIKPAAYATRDQPGWSVQAEPVVEEVISTGTVRVFLDAPYIFRTVHRSSQAKGPAGMIEVVLGAKPLETINRATPFRGRQDYYFVETVSTDEIGLSIWGLALNSFKPWLEMNAEATIPYIEMRGWPVYVVDHTGEDRPDEVMTSLDTTNLIRQSVHEGSKGPAVSIYREPNGNERMLAVLEPREGPSQGGPGDRSQHVPGKPVKSKTPNDLSPLGPTAITTETSAMVFADSGDGVEEAVKPQDILPVGQSIVTSIHSDQLGDRHDMLRESMAKSAWAPSTAIRVDKFPDGELRAIIVDPAEFQDRDVLLVQTLKTNNDFVELLLTLGGLRDSGARKINLMLPEWDRQSLKRHEGLLNMIASFATVYFGENEFYERGTHDFSDVTLTKYQATSGSFSFLNSAWVRLADKLPSWMRSRDMVLYTPNYRDLKEQVAKKLDDTDSQYIKAETLRNPSVTMPWNVFGRKVFLVHTTRTPRGIVEMYLFLSELKRRGAREIVLVAPHFGYARQHQNYSVPKYGPNAKSANSAKILLEAIHQFTHRLYSVNIHFFKEKNEGQQRFEGVEGLDIISLDAFPLIVEHIIEKIGLENPILIGPDEGVSSYVKAAAQARDLDSDHLKKTRTDQEIVLTPKELSVQGRDVILLDDMIAGGSTSHTAGHMMLEQGASRVFAGTVHGILMKGKESVLDGLLKTGGGPFTDVVATNTLSSRASAVSVAPLILEAIKREERQGDGVEGRHTDKFFGMTAPLSVQTAPDFSSINVILHQASDGSGDLAFVLSAANRLRAIYPDKTVRAIFHTGDDMMRLHRLDSRIDTESETQELDGVTFVNLGAPSIKSADVLEQLVKREAQYVGPQDVALVYVVYRDDEDLLRKTFYKGGETAGVVVYAHEFGIELPWSELSSMGGTNVTKEMNLGHDDADLAYPISDNFRAAVERYVALDEERRYKGRRAILRTIGVDAGSEGILAKQQWGFIYAHEGRTLQHVFNGIKQKELQNSPMTLFVVSRPNKEEERHVIDGFAGDMSFRVLRHMEGRIQVSHEGQEQFNIIHLTGIPSSKFDQLLLFSEDLPLILTGQDTLHKALYLNSKLKQGRAFVWAERIFQSAEALRKGVTALSESVGTSADRGIVQNVITSIWRVEELAKLFSDHARFRPIYHALAQDIFGSRSFEHELAQIVGDAWAEYESKKRKPLPGVLPPDIQANIAAEEEETEKSVRKGDGLTVSGRFKTQIGDRRASETISTISLDTSGRFARRPALRRADIRDLVHAQGISQNRYDILVHPEAVDDLAEVLEALWRDGMVFGGPQSGLNFIVPAYDEEGRELPEIYRKFHALVYPVGETPAVISVRQVERWLKERHKMKFVIEAVLAAQRGDDSGIKAPSSVEFTYIADVIRTIQDLKNPAQWSDPSNPHNIPKRMLAYLWAA